MFVEEVSTAVKLFSIQPGAEQEMNSASVLGCLNLRSAAGAAHVQILKVRERRTRWRSDEEVRSLFSKHHQCSSATRLLGEIPDFPIGIWGREIQRESPSEPGGLGHRDDPGRRVDLRNILHAVKLLPHDLHVAFHSVFRQRCHGPSFIVRPRSNWTFIHIRIVFVRGRLNQPVRCRLLHRAHFAEKDATRGGGTQIGLQIHERHLDVVFTHAIAELNNLDLVGIRCESQLEPRESTFEEQIRGR